MSTFLKIVLDFPPASSKNYSRLIAENLLEVVLLSPRKDLALHAVYSKSRMNPDSPSHTEIYLYIVWKLLKANSSVHDESLFSKVFLEKILAQSFELTPFSSSGTVLAATLATTSE